MGKFCILIAALGLLLGATVVLAQEQATCTRLVIPVVNQTQGMLLLDLDGLTTTPGRRYLDEGKSVALVATDQASEDRRLDYEHTLDISRVDHGIEPWCRVKIKTANAMGRPGALLTYCVAASSNEDCSLQVYNDAQVCWVLVTVR